MWRRIKLKIDNSQYITLYTNKEEKIKADKAMKSIALFTMSGQCIKKESIGSSEARIVTDGLVPGVYLIRILIENGSVRNFKFVKY